MDLRVPAEIFFSQRSVLVNFKIESWLWRISQLGIGDIISFKIKKSWEEDENDAREEEMHVCVGSSCCRRSKRFWAIAPPAIRPVQTCWSWSFIFKMLIISPSLENYHLMMLKWSFHRTIKSWGWKIYSILQDDCIVLYVTQSLIFDCCDPGIWSC